jgi:hypothetical protein
VAGVEVDGFALRVRFAPLSGHAGEIEDLIPLGPRGSLTAVKGIGRLLRILRAGRMRVPSDPYTLGDDPQRAAELLLRCLGATVALTLARRFERVLTIWTESGVERIQGVIDYSEDAEGLSVSRRGGGRALTIPRHSLIRFAPSSTEHFEVISVEIPARSRLR